MSAECTLENSDLATNNNTTNFCLLKQNWWPQDNNIHHPISSSLSSCNTIRSSNFLWQQQQEEEANHNQQSSDSSSCEEDVQNSATNNLQQYQFLLDNSTSFISGETAASSDHNHLIWSQLLLSSSTSETAGNLNTKNLLENNNQDAISEMSILDGASTLISSKSCFDHNQLANDDDDYFHPYSNLLLGRQIDINYTDNINAMEPSSHQYWRHAENGHQEVKLPRHHCGILPQVDNSCADDLNSRNFPDFNISFGNYLTKPLVANFNDFKPSLKTLNLAQHKKQGLQPSLTKSRGTKSTCSTLTRNGRAQEISSEVKKRRSDDNSETNSKRQKNETSAVSSPKIQVPKVKLAEKITALQQIVSPFGKTDTASVLWETINYVRFLQEQIQLLSHAYMKSNTCKERWGGFDRKDDDLRSRGLCLVPISCTPQIYRESNNGSDYLIPSYRGCLYR